MAKVFGFNDKGNGSYIDSVSKTAGVPTSVSFKRKDKGLNACSIGITGKVDFGTTLGDNLGDSVSKISIIVSCKIDGVNTNNGIFAISDFSGSLGIIRVSCAANNGLSYSIGATNHVIASAYKNGKSFFMIMTYDSSRKKLYIDNVLKSDEIKIGTLDATGLKTIINAYWDTGSWGLINGGCYNVEVFDHILSSQERAKAYNDFLMASPKITEKYPKLNMNCYKPTDLSSEPNIIAAYNMILSAGNVLTDISNNAGNGVNDGCISSINGLNFDGRDDKISLFIPAGIAATVKTIAFRIKLNSTSEKILEGLAGDHYIYADTGVLNFADYDLSYVNGVATSTVVADQWMNIVITSSTNVSNATATLGLNGTNYSKFEMADLRYFSDEKSAEWAASYSNSFIKSVLGSFPDNCSDAIGNAPVGIQKGTGTYTVQELTSQDAVLKDLDIGTKVLQCDAAGTCAISNINMPGEIELDIYKKDASTINISFIDDRKTNASSSYEGYRISIGTTEVIYFIRDSVGSNAILFNTVASYIAPDVWYRIKITRTISGSFAMFISGGSFGNKYVLVDTTGGSGSNPVVDTTHTDTQYIVLDLDVNDRVIIR